MGDTVKLTVAEGQYVLHQGQVLGEGESFDANADQVERLVDCGAVEDPSGSKRKPAPKSDE